MRRPTRASGGAQPALAQEGLRQARRASRRGVSSPPARYPHEGPRHEEGDMHDYPITAFWDAEAAVWVATSEDAPRLTTEAPTVEALIDKLRIMIPELLECARQSAHTPISFHLPTERRDIAVASWWMVFP